MTFLSAKFVSPASAGIPSATPPAKMIELAIIKVRRCIFFPEKVGTLDDNSHWANQKTIRDRVTEST
jgi:hypothetical protein